LIEINAEFFSCHQMSLRRGFTTDDAGLDNKTLKPAAFFFREVVTDGEGDPRQDCRLERTIVS
jgi:hypothetical protein